jgi:hypothetical protein
MAVTAQDKLRELEDRLTRIVENTEAGSLSAASILLESVTRLQSELLLHLDHQAPRKLKTLAISIDDLCTVTGEAVDNMQSQIDSLLPLVPAQADHMGDLATC